MCEATARVSVLVIGDLFSPEMKNVERRVKELARASHPVRIFPNVAEALARTSTDAWHSDLVIVCQHWPDEYTPSEVRQLLGAFPLARVICCYGPWCASDGRTRDVWPLSVRVPAEFSAGRMDLELEVVNDARSPLPLTASRDEIFLFDPDCKIPAAPAN